MGDALDRTVIACTGRLVDDALAQCRRRAKTFVDDALELQWGQRKWLAEVMEASEAAARTSRGFGCGGGLGGKRCVVRVMKAVEGEGGEGGGGDGGGDVGIGYVIACQNMMV